MRITLVPQRRDGTLTVSKVGDVLTINGEPFDFSVILDGASLPASAVACDLVTGAIERIAGELHLSLFLPLGPNPSWAQAFPTPITMTTDGPVPLPE